MSVQVYAEHACLSPIERNKSQHTTNAVDEKEQTRSPWTLRPWPVGLGLRRRFAPDS